MTSRLSRVLPALLAVFACAGGAAAAADATAPSGHVPGMGQGGSRRHIKQEDLGVQIVALRTTAGGLMLDLRVRVIDPDKSLPLLGRASRDPVHLLVDRTAQLLAVPDSNAGALRQRTMQPVAGHIYTLLFHNPGVVQPGDQVTLVVGDRSVGGLVVASGAPEKKPGA